jgi:hypothetical protein
MAGTFKFHSKLHRASHHTAVTNISPDAGLDPIASIEFPFLGAFYNIITDNNRSFSIATNSIEWWSTYNTVNSLSSSWANALSLYTTVRSLSDSWNDGYSGFLSFSPNSASYISTYTTVSTFSAEWSYPFIMFTNAVQQYTASKTFSGTNLTTVIAPSTIPWDLDYNQSAFLTMNNDYFVQGPTNLRKGGLYTLTCVQTNVGDKKAVFDTAYRFNGTPDLENIIDTAPGTRTVITFVSDGVLMFGDVTKYLE